MTDDRGQMILIAAVLVAVSILGSVVLLNVLHVPADINTKQDARSLDAVEQTTTQVSDDLDRLFRVHTSVSEVDERVPYAKATSGPDPDFSDSVENYSSVNAELSASASSRVVRVEFLDSESQRGTFIRHNDTDKNLTVDDGSWNALTGADSVPYLHLNVSGYNESVGGGIADGQEFEVIVNGETITFDEGEVELPNGDSLTGTHSELYPVELEIVGGHGEIRNETRRKTFEVDHGSPGTVEFIDANKTTGSYTISGAGNPSSALAPGAGPYRYRTDGVLVNPKFQVNVTDASVTHSTTFALYNQTGP